MEGGKKVIGIVVLIIVIGLAIVFAVKRSDIGGPKMPEWLLAEERERVDMQTGDLITKTVREWRKLGHKEGKYKSPETGKYTMVSPMVCGSCGAKIPPPELPMVAPPALGEEGVNPAEYEKQREEIERIRRDYMCPKCGQPAFVDIRPGGP